MPLSSFQLVCPENRSPEIFPKYYYQGQYPSGREMTISRKAKDQESKEDNQGGVSAKKQVFHR